MNGHVSISGIAAAASAAVAALALIVGVVGGIIRDNRESDRRDWERLQALAQVLHQGLTSGLWAQRLAIQELAGLSTKRTQALLLAQAALIYWQNANVSQPDLLNDLRELIKKLS